MIFDFLYLRKSDRKLLLTLLTVAAIALVVLLVAGGNETTEVSGLTADTLSSSTSQPIYAQQPIEAIPADGQATTQLFTFDPNTADSAQLSQLGLAAWQIRSLYRYRQAGGIFRRPDDFARLHGLTVGLFERLRPYIRIGRDYQPAATLLHQHSTDTVSRPRLYPEKLTAGQTLDLSTADTSQLRRVPGIGSYFARRIVSYGQQLGGYVSVDQLDEIDDFPAQAKSFLVVSHPSPQQLNVNRLSLQELRRHPYINFYQAKAIVDYRRQHGPLRSLHDLSLLEQFPPDAIRRLEPYVTY